MPSPESPTPEQADAIMQDLSTPELPAHATAPTEMGGIAPTPENYDRLLDPNAPNPTGSVEHAQPPLTDGDIAKMEVHRGQPVSAEQRKHMDMARARGIHHDIV